MYAYAIRPADPSQSGPYVELMAMNRDRALRQANTAHPADGFDMPGRYTVELLRAARPGMLPGIVQRYARKRDLPPT